LQRLTLDIDAVEMSYSALFNSENTRALKELYFYAIGGVAPMSKLANANAFPSLEKLQIAEENSNGAIRRIRDVPDDMALNFFNSEFFKKLSAFDCRYYLDDDVFEDDYKAAALAAMLASPRLQQLTLPAQWFEFYSPEANLDPVHGVTGSQLK